MSSHNKIYLGGVQHNTPEQLERLSSIATKSGMLALVAGAAPGKFKPHDVAGGLGSVYVIKEPILGPVDYTYSLTETTFAYIPKPGEIYQMRTVAAAYTYDQALASDGAGALKAANGTTDIVVAYSDEAITTTSGAPFLRVKFK